MFGCNFPHKYLYLATAHVQLSADVRRWQDGHLISYFHYQLQEKKEKIRQVNSVICCMQTTEFCFHSPDDMKTITNVVQSTVCDL